MDPDYQDEEEEAANMAAMMGFSGFGSQKPPTKKRKFNINTDAFIEGQDLKNIDRGGKKGQGSGGNTMPLGKTRVFGNGAANKAIPSVGLNDSEIDLENDDETEGPQFMDTSLPPPITSHGEGPQYLDTSGPPPATILDQEAREMQSRIDNILASVESREPANTQLLDPHELPQRPNPNHPNKMNDPDSMRGGIRLRDTFSDTASIASSRPSHHSRGQRNENWYLDYYDPSFVENPWARLEKEKGLEPLVKWPEIPRGGKTSEGRP